MDNISWNNLHFFECVGLLQILQQMSTEYNQLKEVVSTLSGFKNEPDLRVAVAGMNKMNNGKISLDSQKSFMN